MLEGGPGDPAIQPAAVFIEQKFSYSETLAEDPMTLRITSSARYPLGPNVILRRGKPLLRKHFYPGILKINHEQCKSRVVVAHRFVTGRNNHLLHASKFHR